MSCYKVALCFSGEVRTFEECWPSYNEILSDYSCDLFAVSPPNDVLHRYPFKKVLYQEDHIIPDRWHYLNNNPQSSQQNMLRQFYFIELCNNLRLEYEQDKGIEYDFIFRIRLDNLMTGKLPSLADCDPRNIYIPTGCDHPEAFPGLGINDRFAFGGSHVMNVYSNKLQILDEYMSDSSSWFFAEVILKWALINQNVKIERFADCTKVKRTDGTLV